MINQSLTTENFEYLLNSFTRQSSARYGMRNIFIWTTTSFQIVLVITPDGSMLLRIDV